MTQVPSTLYAKLLGETAPINWQALQPFFARGALLWIDPSLDLIAVGEAFALDDKTKIAAWLASQQLEKVSDSRALALCEGSADMWAVVISPWVLVQNRAE